MLRIALEHCLLFLYNDVHAGISTFSNKDFTNGL